MFNLRNVRTGSNVIDLSLQSSDPFRQLFILSFLILIKLGALFVHAYSPRQSLILSHQDSGCKEPLRPQRKYGHTLDASAMMALISVWSFFRPALPVDGPASRLTRLSVWLIEVPR